MQTIASSSCLVVDHVNHPIHDLVLARRKAIPLFERRVFCVQVPEPPMFDTDEALALSARAQSVSKTRQSLDLRAESHPTSEADQATPAEREQMEDGNEGKGWVWPKLWFVSVAGKKARTLHGARRSLQHSMRRFSG